MKNAYLLLLGLLLLTGLAGRAQAPAPDPVRQQLDHLLAPLDKSQVPSGLLYESAERLLGLRPFSGAGLSDSNRMDLDVFRYLRATLASARVSGSDTLPDLPALNRRLDARRQGVSGAANPIAVQYLGYHRIRRDALQANLLQVQNGQLFDVPGRPQSPYQVLG